MNTDGSQEYESSFEGRHPLKIYLYNATIGGMT